MPIGRMLPAVAAVVIIILNVRSWSWAHFCVASENCQIFLKTSQFTKERNSVEVQKNPDYDLRDIKEQILSRIVEDLG